MEMDINITISQESIIEFIAAAVALGIISILWQNKKSPEVKFLILVEFFAAIWAVMYGMEFLSTDLETKIFWSRLSYLGISFLPLSFFLFTTSFSHKKKIITPLTVTILSVIPFMTLIFVFTNDFHHLIWKEAGLLPELNMTTYKYGIGFWIFWSYSLSLIAAGLYNLIHSIYVFSDYYKSQISIIVIATLIPLTGNIIYVTGLNPTPGYDWTPVLFIFTGLVITLGIVRYRMFNLVPFAREKLIDTMYSGVIIMNDKGFIEDYNPAAGLIFNWEPGSAIYKHYSEVFKHENKLTEALDSHHEESSEITVQMGKKLKFYQVHYTPLHNRTGKYSGQLVQLNDITSLKETEYQLKAEVEERGRLIEDLDAFTHTVSHDLRNLLGSVYSSGEIIEKNITDGNTELLKEFAYIIRTAAQKALDITRELLILARFSDERVNKKELIMATVFDGAKYQLKEMIAKSSTKISAPDSWPSVYGNPVWVELVWVNYLSNAIKYGGSPPVIDVGYTHTAHDTVQFWVQDDGDGIPPEDHSLLFQRYVRLAPKKAEGYGLGLSIVKRMIKKLGGNVGLDSSGEKGEGAKFWFELPLI